MAGRRIESSASRTADMTCACRAMSFYEPEPALKGADWVAPKLLPRAIQPLVIWPPTRKLLQRMMAPEGVYGWVIARTRYIDEALRAACLEGFAQVLLFGAGFDSRCVRFCSQLRAMRLFELDAPTTQAMKIEQFRRRGIPIPTNVALVAINFEKDSVEQKLAQAGFSRGSKTLVILEGVLQYLNPQSVESTFATIRGLVGTGSRVVFDHAYAAVVRGEGDLYGQRGITRGVSRVGESWQFGLDDGEVEAFLQRFGFALVDKKNPQELEQMNFRRADGSLLARINGTQGLVTAERE